MQINNAKIFVKKLKGTGDLNFVLLHNAGGDHKFFLHQIKMLKKYGDVIQMDLPGHGKSEGIASYEMSDFSSAIVELCKNLSLKNICFIGLNNGANIALDIANYHDLSIKSLILIDPPLFMEANFIQEINNFIDQLAAPTFNEFVTSLVNSLFIETSLSNKKIAATAFNTVNKKCLQKTFRGLIAWNAEMENPFQQIKAPILCVLTDEHHCSYQKLRQKAPHIEIGKLVGSKCWATLEVPQQINSMIERFLRNLNLFSN